jgi:hypothetical protein
MYFQKNRSRAFLIRARRVDTSRHPGMILVLEERSKLGPLFLIYVCGGPDWENFFGATLEQAKNGSELVNASEAMAWIDIAYLEGRRSIQLSYGRILGCSFDSTKVATPIRQPIVPKSWSNFEFLEQILVFCACATTLWNVGTQRAVTVEPPGPRN